MHAINLFILWGGRYFSALIYVLIETGLKQVIVREYNKIVSHLQVGVVCVPL